MEQRNKYCNKVSNAECNVETLPLNVERRELVLSCRSPPTLRHSTTFNPRAKEISNNGIGYSFKIVKFLTIAIILEYISTSSSLSFMFQIEDVQQKLSNLKWWLIEPIKILNYIHSFYKLQAYSCLKELFYLREQEYSYTCKPLCFLRKFSAKRQKNNVPKKMQNHYGVSKNII